MWQHSRIATDSIILLCMLIVDLFFNCLVGTTG
jgi:hypothetical protein